MKSLTKHALAFILLAGLATALTLKVIPPIQDGPPDPICPPPPHLCVR